MNYELNNQTKEKIKLCYIFNSLNKIIKYKKKVIRWQIEAKMEKKSLVFEWKPDN